MFVTKIEFQSGDRDVLEGVVGDLKSDLRQKGVDWKGPHSESPQTHRVPLYSSIGPGNQFDSWAYTVYSRHIEIHGSEQIARDIATQAVPDSVHVEVEVDRKRPLGQKD
jgi:SSU ribosomal protein S10P